MKKMEIKDLNVLIEAIEKLEDGIEQVNNLLSNAVDYDAEPMKLLYDGLDLLNKIRYDQVR